jgi:sulfur-oxidizing protein SoxZ
MAAKKSGIKFSAKHINDEARVKVIMPHPMENGARKDKKTGEVIPAHFIKEVTVESGGKVRFSALLSGGISANPFLSFKFKGNKGDMVKVTWVDSKGETETGEAKIK